MPHPAQIKDAVQVYIERRDRPVRSWQIKDGIANRLDTPHVLVAEALMRLEQGGQDMQARQSGERRRVLVFADGKQLSETWPEDVRLQPWTEGMWEGRGLRNLIVESLLPGRAGSSGLPRPRRPRLRG